MNENKKILVIVLVVVAIFALIPIVAIINVVKSKNIIEEFHETMNSEDLNLIYIGRDNCSYCNLFDEEIEFIDDEFDIDYLYINTNKLTNKDFDELLTTLDINEDDFGTPYILITQNGEKLAEQPGYIPENQLFDFLQEYGLIEEDETLPLNYIDYEEYTNIIASQEKQIVVIAQSGCDGCLKARPVLYELAHEYGLKINYLNASFIDSENAEAFQTSLSYFEENGISTPTMLVVSNNEVIDVLVGSVELEEYIDFLKTNSLMEE